MILKYQNEETTYDVEFKKISKNIVEIKGDFPIKDVGFTLSRPDMNDGWAYSSYTTIYKELDNGVQFSNDGSVYVEPVIPTPTAEELAEIEERERVSAIQNEINELKAQLETTDYKVIKCYEYGAVGIEKPYNVEELHSERQAIRDIINEKEHEINDNQL